MRKMKRLLCATLVLSALLSLAACGNAGTASSAATSAPAASAEQVAFNPYNSGGFNIPGLTFQPQRPDTQGVRHEPTEVFKNVYFIGDSWINCLLYVTDQGNIIMWDALEYASDYEDILKPDMEKLGLDPAKIKTILLSHGHFDHIGMSGLLEQTNGAQVYICQDDEALMLSNGKADGKYADGSTPLPKNYKFMKDGDTYTLDNVTFTLMHTPGHTAGSMSFFVPVTAFDGTQHILTCWGGTSAPKDEAGIKTYMASIEKYRAAIKEKHADCFLSMHPFVDYSSDKVETVRTTGSSDALIRTPEQMDFFCWSLEVYTQTKGQLAANGVTDFREEGYGPTALNIPYMIYMPDGTNGALYLEDEIAAEIFQDVYFIGTGNVGTTIYDTSDGLVMVDTMNSEDDFKNIIAPNMEKLGLDPADITTVFVTHGHGDHYGSAAYIRETYGAKIYMKKLDIETANVSAKKAQEAGREPAVLPEIDVDLVEGSYTVGKFTFDWYYTPGHTIGCMSYLTKVADFAGKDHTLCCWGGTGLNNDKALMEKYCASVESFRDTCVAKGADVELSIHPFVDYSTENIRAVQSSGSSDALVRGVENVRYFFTCISLTAQDRLASL